MGWRKYCMRRAILKREWEAHDAMKGDDSLPEYKNISDVVTAPIMDPDKELLDGTINEWFLFHGTSAAAAENICKMDFKMGFAGNHTDEYSKPEAGINTVLLCR